jgi:hypothetical protein
MITCRSGNSAVEARILKWNSKKIEEPESRYALGLITCERKINSEEDPKVPNT